MCGSRLEWEDKRGRGRRGQRQEREREERRERVRPSAITEIEIPQPRELSHHRTWLFTVLEAGTPRSRPSRSCVWGGLPVLSWERGVVLVSTCGRRDPFTVLFFLLLLFWFCLCICIFMTSAQWWQPSILTKWFLLILWTKVLCGLTVATLGGPREIWSRDNFKTNNKKGGNQRPTNSGAGPGHIPTNVARASEERWGATCHLSPAWLAPFHLCRWLKALCMVEDQCCTGLHLGVVQDTTWSFIDSGLQA